MRIDLPSCDFESCRFFSDNNCTNENKCNKCAYKRNNRDNTKVTMANIIGYLAKDKKIEIPKYLFDGKERYNLVTTDDNEHNFLVELKAQEIK